MLGTILLIIAGIFAAIIVAGIFIPSKYAFSKSIRINSERKLVFNMIDDLSTWEKWSAWSKENDAKIAITLGEKSSGTGASMTWKGTKMGKGSMEVENAEPYKLIEVEAVFNKGVFRMNFTISFEEMGERDTLVDWKVSGRTRRGGFAKILGRMLPKWMGKDIETSLKVLKHYCEGSLA